MRAAPAGDWDIGHGPLAVPEAQALDLVKAVLADDVDVAYSYRMQADHGFTQPLELLCGGIARYTNVDANLIRLIAVVGLLLGAGSLGVAYLIAWVLMPEE